VIADAMLVFGYGEDRRTIDVDLTNIVLSELETTGVLAPPVRANVPSADLLPALAAREREFAARTAALAEREDRIAEQQRALLRERWLARGHAASGPPTLNADQLAERGARMRRRDDPEYRDYVRVEQRHRPLGPAPFQRGDGRRACPQVFLISGQATGRLDESPAPPASGDQGKRQARVVANCAPPRAAAAARRKHSSFRRPFER
jgi:hypothetical protein